MRQILMILTAILLSCCSSESDVKAQETQPSSSGKVLVAYFSFTSNTKAYAEKIAEITGGDLYEIVPEVAYGSENSNYYDQSTRAYKEQYNTGGEQRPAIKETLENTAQYDVVFLGSPIWYGKSPRVILTFLDKYGFKGKTVIPFVTSGSSGISNVNSELSSSYPDINWKEGRRLNGVSDADLRTWIQEFIGTTAQKLYITIGGVSKTATLVDNSATQTLVAKLQEAPVTVTLNSSGGFEIWGALGFSLPTSNEQINAQPGDIVLYNGSNICMFYGTNSWSYTRLGKIEGLSESELRTFLKAGESNISVTLSLSNTTGISQVRNDENQSKAYTLQGTLAQAGHKGIIIKNGKKQIR